MKSYELVAKTIKGENTTGVTPIYAWVFDNVIDKITNEFGSMSNFEDHYQLDMAHLFGGPSTYSRDILEKAKASGEEITPEFVLDMPQNDPNNMEDYKGIIAGIEHHRNSRERFCYVQTNGIFESTNELFGIEDHLCNMAAEPELMAEIYQRRASWNKQFASNVIELGIDMVHISDDWGAQNSLMFSPQNWWDMIYPSLKQVTEFVKSKDKFVSLHSDGNVNAVLDGIVDLGFDVVHPYQETAGMSYDTYLEKYADKFAILGGVCIQSTLGFGDYKRLEQEINRVFGLLKGKRWMCCTTHIVQPHCSIEELVYAYDLIFKLSNKSRV